MGRVQFALLEKCTGWFELVFACEFFDWFGGLFEGCYLFEGEEIGGVWVGTMQHVILTEVA